MNNNMNPTQFIAMMKNGGNPQQMVMNLLQSQMQGNPLYENLYNLASQGKTRDIEAIARNVTKAQGIDFDKEFSAFRKKLGL